MEKVLEFIKQNNLIKKGSVIGVGVSGGSDSMALLHYLASIQDELDFEVVGIHVNHGIREESREEEAFVVRKCRELGVRVYRFKIDSYKLAKDNNQSLETAAREGRYGVFKSLIQRDVVDRIALAHHESDQAETILMHIFRGAGVAGARGMEPIRDGTYIRPMLTTSKQEIMAYIMEHSIDYVQDNSNYDNQYNRNFVRNVLMPQVIERWPGAEKAIINFGKAVTEDDDYINSNIYEDAIMFDGKVAQIPVSYFLYPNSVINRLVIRALKAIGVTKDFERKHIEMIKDIALHGENGKKVQLPYDTVAVREYDFLTITNNFKAEGEFLEPLDYGTMIVPNFGKIIIKRVRTSNRKTNVLYADFRKIPKTAMWRYRQDGDVFTKFGGGTKKLKSFLIDKKIPQRLRNSIPVLAKGNEVYIIAGVEISDKVKVENVPTAMSIEVIQTHKKKKG